MAMLLKVVACLALFVALAQAVKPGEEYVRTDKWCGEHHFGAGAAGCVKHSGCAYDERAKKCHSSTFHSDEWCDEVRRLLCQSSSQAVACMKDQCVGGAEESERLTPTHGQ